VDTTVTDSVKTLTNVEASFPPGALATNTVIKVAEIKASEIVSKMPTTIFKAKASTVEFSPSTTFTKPVTITIPLPLTSSKVGRCSLTPS